MNSSFITSRPKATSDFPRWVVGGGGHNPLYPPMEKIERLYLRLKTVTPALDCR